MNSAHLGIALMFLLSCGGTTGPQNDPQDGSTFDVAAPRRENWCSLNAPDAAVCDDFDGYRTLEDVTLAGWTSKTATPSSMLGRLYWDPVSAPTCVGILSIPLRPEEFNTPRPWMGLLTRSFPRARRGWRDARIPDRLRERLEFGPKPN